MQEVIDALVPVLAPVLATAVVGGIAIVLRNLNKFVKAHTSAKEYGILAAIATTAVQAVEQQYFAETSDSKKSLAFQYVESALDSKGIKVDLDTIDSAIEAAVNREFGA